MFSIIRPSYNPKAITATARPYQAGFFMPERHPMTLKERLADLVDGWALTVRKASVQIMALNMAWQSLVTVAPAIMPDWLANLITLALTGLALVASNATQTSIASYDPTKFALYDPSRFRLVPVGPANV